MILETKRLYLREITQSAYDCFILGKSVNCGFSCFGGGQLASVVLISMYSAIRRNSSANLK